MHSRRIPIDGHEQSDESQSHQQSQHHDESERSDPHGDQEQHRMHHEQGHSQQKSGSQHGPSGKSASPHREHEQHEQKSKQKSDQHQERQQEQKQRREKQQGKQHQREEHEKQQQDQQEKQLHERQEKQSRQENQDQSASHDQGDHGDAGRFKPYNYGQSRNEDGPDPQRGGVADRQQDEQEGGGRMQQMHALASVSGAWWVASKAAAVATAPARTAMAAMQGAARMTVRTVRAVSGRLAPATVGRVVADVCDATLDAIDRPQRALTAAVSAALHPRKTANALLPGPLAQIADGVLGRAEVLVPSVLRQRLAAM